MYLNDNDFPNLSRLFESVEEVLAKAEAARRSLADEVSAEQAELWTAAAFRYGRVALRLLLELDRHPEWVFEFELVLEPIGCPAQSIPEVEEYLRDKGVQL